MAKQEIGVRLSEEELIGKSEELFELIKTKLSAYPEFASALIKAFFEGDDEGEIAIGVYKIEFEIEGKRKRMTIFKNGLPEDESQPDFEMIMIRSCPRDAVYHGDGNIHYVRLPFDREKATTFMGCVEAYDAAKKFINENF